MRRVRDLDLDLPWQIEGLIIGLSTVLSTAVVVIGWLVFGSAMNAMIQGIGLDAGVAVPTFVSFGNAWPWLLVVLLIVTLRFYSFIKGKLIRRLESLSA